MKSFNRLQAAIERWTECLARNAWPAYPARVCHAELPAWAEAAWMERELRDDGRPVSAQLMGDR